jgi:hypothetical protein
MKINDFKRICDSEEIGNLYGIFYYPDNLLHGDPRLRTVSVFARYNVMPDSKELFSYSITPDYQVIPEHQEDAWGWRTYFNTNTPHSDLVRKFEAGQGTEEELRELIHIFKKGYKETLIKDKITTIEKDFV